MRVCTTMQDIRLVKKTLFNKSAFGIIIPVHILSYPVLVNVVNYVEPCKLYMYTTVVRLIILRS